MLDFETAKGMAQDFLDKDMRPAGNRYLVLAEKIRETCEAWFFPYQSQQLLHTGDQTRFVTEGLTIAVRKDGGKKV